MNKEELLVQRIKKILSQDQATFLEALTALERVKIDLQKDSMKRKVKF
ncbi:MAG TPA: hypothetical protein K8W17_04085 [Lapidilactobacillus dextrinicus]|uniref:Uncharacterized protein n=1 Tax=Lapidilactobacillus dextrinicus TaxID=51664 RepID=A0A921B3N7_9LACO|nr:hypothetical protein [Lapidilactobacillus dextrinicus]